MSLSEAQVQRLLGFVGYGRLEAPLWFIGMEESLGPRPEFAGWTPSTGSSLD